MKKRVLLGLVALAASLSISIGVAYGAACESAGGGRACGSDCSATADGGCRCTGSCSADELKWVDGAKKDVAMLESVVN